MNQLTREQQIAALEKEWAENARKAKKTPGSKAPSKGPARGSSKPTKAAKRAKSTRRR